MKRGLLAACLLLVMASWGVAQTARVQLIHNSADIDARRVDIYVADTLFAAAVTFRTATPFLEFPPGTTNFKIAPPGILPADSLLAEAELDLEAGMSYVAIANGISDLNLGLGKYFNPDPANRSILFEIFPIGDVREAASDPAKVDFFVFHGSTDAPAVDVLTGPAVLVSNLDYGENTGYLSVDPNVYDLDVTPAGDNANIVASFRADLSGLAGGAGVVFASGFLDPTNNEGGQRLGLFAALPTGDVVEFENITRGPIGEWVNAGASDYEFVDFFGGDTAVVSGHGVAVDKYNRVWFGNFGSAGVLHVLNADGTPASFSPIASVTVGATTYAMNSCRGMGVAADGNILFCRGAVVIKINVEDGTGMAAWEGTGSRTAPAVDEEGFIYTGAVAGTSPIAVIDNDLNLITTIPLPNAPSFTRGIEVSDDGKKIWSGDLGESGGPVREWSSEDLLTYELTDSIFTNTEGEQVFKVQRVTLDFGPDGRMWVSSDAAYGDRSDPNNGFVILDFAKKEYQFLPVPEIGEGIPNGPRGVAFSVTGDTAYATSFNGNRMFRFVRTTPQIARVQLIHNSADIDARRVDVYVADTLFAAGVTFRTATPFLDFPAGVTNFKIAPPGIAPEDSLLAEAELNLEAGKSYVAIANGISELNINLGKYVNPDPANRSILFDIFPIADAKEAATDPATVEFIGFHGSTDAPAIDAIVSGSFIALINDLNYGQNTGGYFPASPGVYDLDVTPADDNSTILASFRADLSTLAGQAVVVFASGFLDPANNEGGQRLGLFAALPSGDVVEFENITRGPIGEWKNAGASDYQFTEFFGADTTVLGGHGVAVDKYNRVWFGNFSSAGVLHVLNADGTPASFSPIASVTVGATTYAMNSCRGMGVAADGNILFCRGAVVIKINVDDGTGMAAWEGTGSRTAPAVDEEGFIYTGAVAGTSPIAVIDNDLNLITTIPLPNAPSFTRGIEVSDDGKKIWSGDLGESGGPVREWSSEDLLTYELTDSIFTNTEGEQVFKVQRVTLDFGPDGRLWVSSDAAYGDRSDPNNGFVILDLEKKEYQFLPVPEIGAGVPNGPRGVAFSVTGDTAYATSFNGNRMFRFVREGVSVGDQPIAIIPSSYQLGQNYPNPFNPSTTIPFDVAQPGRVEIKIFDTLGREVATILDMHMLAGRHNITFDASKLPSGVYHYRIRVNDFVSVKKMMLVK